MTAIYAQVQGASGSAIWAVGDASAPVTVTAPTDVAGVATGGTTGTISWVDASGNEQGFRVQLEVPTGSGNWIDAAGSTNPTAAGVQVFGFTGAPAAATLTPRVQSFLGSVVSAWVTGSPFTLDNVGSGGGVIPAGPTAPSVVTQPESVSVGAGAEVVLTTAFAGVPAPALQWRRNGVAIAGATSPTYTFTATLSDNGASFDCVGTNIGGTIATLLVSLTVALPAPPSVGLDAFMPFVLPHVPGCPWELAQQHVRQACIEWFQRTLCWRMKTLTTSGEGVDQYPIPVVAGSVVAKLLAGWIDTRPVKLPPADTAPHINGQAVLWTEDRATFRVSPIPGEQPQKLELLVALKPSQDTASVPEAQFEQYAEHIADGALARLFAMAGKKWTDKAEAVTRKAAFDNSVASAHALSLRAFARSDVRTRSQWM